jgi:hypothetical protein
VLLLVLLLLVLLVQLSRVNSSSGGRSISKVN